MERTQQMERTVLGAGTDARRGIHRINKAMKEIRANLCPYDPNTCSLLNVTAHLLGNQSIDIKQVIQRNGLLIDQAISAAYIANLVVVTVNLAFVVAALVFSLLHWNYGFLIIIFLCWILTTACWVLTGLDYFLHIFAEDTCTAIDGFLQNPLKNSLSSLIPCARFLKSEHFMVDIGHTIHGFIEQLNSALTELPKQLGMLDQADRVVASPKICDPFSGAPDFSYVNKCPRNAIPIAEIPNILEIFTCYGDKDNSSCLPQRYYAIAQAYIKSIQKLIKVYPDLHDLIHCSFVKDRMSEAGLRLCKPFKTATKQLWISLLCLSTTMAVLLVLWVSKAYQDRGRTFSSMCSIAPSSTHDP